MKQLVLTVGPDFSKQVLEGWVVQGDRIYAMKSTKDGLEFGDSDKQSLEAFVSASGLQQFELLMDLRRQMPSPTWKASSGAGKTLDRLEPWRGKDFTQPNASSPAANERVQVYLFARSPESFCITGTGLGHEIGYVLYHFDLFKPGTAGGI